ncbi:prepilin-type N-terminal cleavage/methylation domain-containing protein [Ruminococcus flavefaciens]|jgi:prepilin-type N-terminal cleavage/methylation domain-containing protein|uniref:Prepilin-type N-terminal cleavage/methylation domain-containing protein n=1 Tax=Ruminococcus flavefaciens TaxID=1265 RepID=A0A1H6IY18_RUMFL|nr:type II secretion system protein [Ruminococcus flavefaciens]SEH54577.1 prepilin-type N-terminal cleavage/methylation domain-containing protein [Ruminococcus flavefaciens]
MKHRIKKGFTLIELIVVMAIFSILMVAVMAITGPVQRLFHKTALSEKTYSYANNIQLNLQGKLEYAENISVCTSDKIDFNGVDGVDDEDLAKLAEEYRSSHFKNTVGYDGTNVKYLKGNIHIIKLCNNACKDSKGNDVEQGQILHRVYSFDTKAADKITSSTSYTEEKDLNDAFFNAQDAVYSFNYSLGASNLKVVNLPNDPSLSSVDKDIVYRAIEDDINDKSYLFSAANIGISIVLSKSDGGFVDVPAGAGNNAYRAFSSPVAVQVANIPLTNINIRAKTVPAQFMFKGVQRPKMETEGGSVTLQAHGDTGSAFDTAYANPNFSFTNDLYFVYSYTDEMY